MYHLIMVKKHLVVATYSRSACTVQYLSILKVNEFKHASLLPFVTSCKDISCHVLFDDTSHVHFNWPSAATEVISSCTTTQYRNCYTHTNWDHELAESACTSTVRLFLNYLKTDKVNSLWQRWNLLNLSTMYSEDSAVPKEWSTLR